MRLATPAKTIPVFTAVIAVTACSTAIFGSARPAAELQAGPTSTSAAPTGPPSVPGGDVKSLLLGVSDLERITGDTAMKNTGVITEPTFGVGSEPWECTSVSQAAILGPLTLRTGMAGNMNVGDGKTSVAQVVVSYPPDTARFLDTTLIHSGDYSWSKCPEGAPHSFIVDNKVLHYVRGPILISDTRIGVTATRQEPPPRTCRHVLAYKANVSTDVVVCGAGDTTRQADEIVDRILADVPG